MPNLHSPKITVAIATYNSASCVRECLETVKSQTFNNKELVVIDGNSSDDTMSIVNEYADIPHVFISEKDNGIYDAMNKALKYATGDFLIFLGSDDKFYDSSVLEKVAAYMTSDDCIYYGNVFRTGRKDMYCGRYNDYKLAVKNICHQAIFYPKSIYKQHNYNTRYRLFADYAYNLSLWKNSQWTYIPLTITIYESNGASATSRDENFENERQEIIISHLGIWPYIYSEIYHFLRNLIRK